MQRRTEKLLFALCVFASRRMSGIFKDTAGEGNRLSRSDWEDSLFLADDRKNRQDEE